MEIGESDRLITLFTQEYGVIRAFVTGAKKINNKKACATSLLSYSTFSIIKRKDTYKVYEVQPIKIFFNVSSDLERLTLAQYFCELCIRLIPEGTENPEFLRLILNSLHFLSEGNKNHILVKAITELRAVSILGYAPDLVACCDCGKFEDNVMFLNLEEGNIFCKTCDNGSNAPVSPTVLSAMRHIVFSEFNNIYAFNVSEKSADELSAVTEKYLTTQTENRFKTLDFFNSIRQGV